MLVLELLNKEESKLDANFTKIYLLYKENNIL
jgi:hypothetical protein